MLGVLVSIKPTPFSLSSSITTWTFANMGPFVQRHWGEPSPDPNDQGEWDVHTVTERPCVQPNFLAYNDGLTARKILIPDGKLDHVVEMYSRSDFGALGRYETLGGDGG